MYYKMTKCVGLLEDRVEEMALTYVSMRQHTSAYVSIRQHTSEERVGLLEARLRVHQV